MTIKIAGRAVLACVVGLLSEPAAAETLSDTLDDAYNNNAQIQAQRYQQRQTDEQLPQALSGWRPTVTVTGGVTRMHQYFGPFLPGTSPVGNLTPRMATLSVTQPIYRGGQTVAETGRAEATIAAGAAQLDSVQQEQLLTAANAYLDVFRDAGLVDLNASLVDVLTVNQHDVQVTFNAGAATETDTSQAAARLEGAIAGRLAAEAQLKSSIARFRQAVGRDPGKLAEPAFLGQLPASEEEAIAIGLKSNPTVVQARNQLEANKQNVDVVRAGLLPKLNGIIQLQHQDDELFKGLKQNSAAVGLQAQVPIYEAGNVYSQVRAAHEGVSASERSIDVAERQIREQITTAWNALAAARAQQRDYEAQIKANAVALRDTGREVEVGTRIRLDVLNAQQELFGSKVNLVSAQHDTFLAAYQLQVATGAFTPAGLGLTVAPYDPSKHLDAVRDQWIGTTPSDAE